MKKFGFGKKGDNLLLIIILLGAVLFYLNSKSKFSYVIPESNGQLGN